MRVVPVRASRFVRLRGLIDLLTMSCIPGALNAGLLEQLGVILHIVTTETSMKRCKHLNGAVRSPSRSPVVLRRFPELG